MPTSPAPSRSARSDHEYIVHALNEADSDRGLDPPLDDASP